MLQHKRGDCPTKHAPGEPKRSRHTPTANAIATTRWRNGRYRHDNNAAKANAAEVWLLGSEFRSAAELFQNSHE